MSDQYAQQPAGEDPLDVQQRIRSQYSTDAPKTTLGNYDWQAPGVRRIAQPRRLVPNVSVQLPDIGGGGGGGGEQQVKVRVQREGGGAPPGGEHEEEPPGSGTAPEGGELTVAPSWGSGRDFDDSPVGNAVGSMAGRTVTSRGKAITPYM